MFVSSIQTTTPNAPFFTDTKSALLQERPRLPTPSASSPMPPLPKEVEINNNYSQKAYQSFCKRISALWNYGRIVYFPKLASPSILFGSLLASTGIVLFITSCLGVQITALELLLQNVPLSFMFSLLMMRAGLHMISYGIRLSNSKQRARNEVLQQYRLLALKQQIKPLSSIEMHTKILHLHHLDSQLSKKMRILEPPTLLPPHKTAPLTLPPIKEVHLQLSKENFQYHGKIAQKWYNWWYRQLPLLGKCEMLLGGLMFVVAIIGFVLLFKGGEIPQALELIADDPYLSLSFSLALLTSAMNCMKNGCRVINYDRREQKRVSLTEELKWISFFLEKHRQNLPITQQEKKYINRARVPVKERNGLFTLYGKTVTPNLATPSIILGVALVALGCYYFSLAFHAPLPSLRFLVKSATNTLPFATGIILSGMHSIYRGASFSEKTKKLSWKKHSKTIRNNLLTRLLYSTPKMPKPNRVDNTPTCKESIYVDPNSLSAQEKEYHRVLQEALNEKWVGPWHTLWLSSLKGLWIPDVILGGVMLYFGIAVFSVLAGWIPPPTELVSAAPSFSLLFSASLLSMSVDALNCSWRMKHYHQRQREDQEAITILYNSFNAHFGCVHPPLPQQKV